MARGGPRWDWALVPLAALGGGMAAAALLATNFEIIFIGLGAWLVLGRRGVARLRARGPARGFCGRAGAPGVGDRGRGLALGLAGPALPVWLFRRPAIRLCAGGTPRPCLCKSSRACGCRPSWSKVWKPWSERCPNRTAHGRRAVFFGLGTEFLERSFPTVPEKGRPLWVHWNTSYDAAAVTRLARRMGQDESYRMVFTTLARNEWPDEILTVLRRDYANDLVGPVIKRWTYWGQGYVNLANSFEVLDRLGGNVDGRILHQDPPAGGFHPNGRWPAPDGHQPPGRLDPAPDAELPVARSRRR